MTGGFYEAGLWTDAVYSGNPLNFDFYYWLSGVGVSFVLLLENECVRIRQNAGKDPNHFAGYF